MHVTIWFDLIWLMHACFEHMTQKMQISGCHKVAFILACRFAALLCECCLQFHGQQWAAMPLWAHHRAALLPSCCKFNCLRSTTAGKVTKLSIYWQNAACCLINPEWQMEFAQLYKYHHQSGKAASVKLVCKQHKSSPWMIGSYLRSAL